jgi:hypothetical protein
MPSKESISLNPDFEEMLSALSAEDARYLLVGAYALAVYGNTRATQDIDFFIRRDPENTQRVWTALANFGAPLLDLSPQDLEEPNIVVQIGVEPHRIDVLTSIDGVEFDDAWARRQTREIGGAPVHVIGRGDLLQNKRASGRTKDRADAEWLEQTAPPTETIHADLRAFAARQSLEERWLQHPEERAEIRARLDRLPTRSHLYTRIREALVDPDIRANLSEEDKREFTRTFGHPAPRDESHEKGRGS